MDVIIKLFNVKNFNLNLRLISEMHSESVNLEQVHRY